MFFHSVQLLIEFFFIWLGNLFFRCFWNRGFLCNIPSLPVILWLVLSLSFISVLGFVVFRMLLFPILFFYFLQIVFLLDKGLGRINKTLLYILLGDVFLDTRHLLIILRGYKEQIFKRIFNFLFK